MSELGLANHANRISELLPQDRQTFLFADDLDGSVRPLADALLRSDKLVRITDPVCDEASVREAAPAEKTASPVNPTVTAAKRTPMPMTKMKPSRNASNRPDWAGALPQGRNARQARDAHRIHHACVNENPATPFSHRRVSTRPTSIRQTTSLAQINKVHPVLGEGCAIVNPRACQAGMICPVPGCRCNRSNRATWATSIGTTRHPPKPPITKARLTTISRGTSTKAPHGKQPSHRGSTQVAFRLKHGRR